MGCVGSNEALERLTWTVEEEKNEVINEELRSDEMKRAKIHKLLLLGPGNAGKSTVFRQFKKIHIPITNKERKTWKKHIHNSIISQMKNIIKICQQKLPKNVENSAKYIQLLDDEKEELIINNETSNHITNLWSSKFIKQTFENKNTMELYDSTPYFFEQIKRIAEKNYIPNDSDLLLTRIPTKGIRQIKFEVKNNLFELYDVGGQRNQRSKWIHLFDNVHAILYIVSLSCYDQFLDENDKINAMDETINLWEEIANLHYFANRRTSMIIFFNKSDIFEKKIKKVSLKIWDKEFKGKKEEIKDSLDFIRDKFLKKVNDTRKQVYTHVTCATDTEALNKIFHDVQHCVTLTALTCNGIL